MADPSSPPVRYSPSTVSMVVAAALGVVVLALAIMFADDLKADDEATAPANAVATGRARHAGDPASNEVEPEMREIMEAINRLPDKR